MTEWLSISGVALLFALCVDVVLGEPAARWHPVVWMGQYLDAVSKWFVPSANSGHGSSRSRAFCGGMVFWLLGAVACTAVAVVLQLGIDVLPFWGAAVALGLLLKPLFAWRMLYREVQAVEDAMAVSLEAARARLAWLCSRDVSQLSAAEVRETLIETLAENLNDSVVAPLFWFVVLGLPGAALYRFANTADAMWGYIGVRMHRDWTWAGKWAAYADDVLSWGPARLTAALLALVAGGVTLSALCRESVKTTSPNSGWPMAAMALSLNVRLSKPSVYCLNPEGQSPQQTHSFLAVQLAGRVVVCVGALGFGVMEVMKVGP